MSDLTNISKCNIAQMIGESNRFLFHVFLVHISACIVNGDNNFFTKELFRTLLITTMAIIMYHIFIRKIIEPKIEKMNLICFNKQKRDKKRINIDKKDPLKLGHKKKIYELRERARDISKRRKNILNKKIKR